MDAQGSSEAGMALRGWGSDTGTHCTVRNLLLRGLGLCTCCLLAVPKAGQVPVRGWLSHGPLQPLSALCPWGAAFKWVLNEPREQCVCSCTCRSGWAAGSHSKDYSQLCLWAGGVLGISLLSKDGPCALKTWAERIVSWGLIFFF